MKWSGVSLEKICTRIKDGAHYSPKSVEDGLPMASVKDLTEYGINLETCRHISKEDFEKLVRQGCQPHVGDILISKDGNSALDTVCEVKKEYKVVLLSSVAIFSPNPTKVIPSYLKYVLSCETTRRYLKSGFITGAAIPRVILKDFYRCQIPLPCLPIQHKIASILSAYDDLIENNSRRIRILEDMAQAIYREWFVHFRFPGHENVQMVDSELGKIPEGWEAKIIREIASYINRGVSPSYDSQSSQVVINQKCIRENRLNLELARKHKSRVPTEKYIKFGDILINSTGIGTLGRLTQVYHNFHNHTVDSHISIVRPSDTINVDYFGFALLDKQTHFDRLGIGSTGQTELSRDIALQAQLFLYLPQIYKIVFRALFLECGKIL